jgi:hypothetical protein
MDIGKFVYVQIRSAGFIFSRLFHKLIRFFRSGHDINAFVLFPLKWVCLFRPLAFLMVVIRNRRNCEAISSLVCYGAEGLRVATFKSVYPAKMGGG